MAASPTPAPAGTRFHRVLLKLSGEALLGNRYHGVDPERLDALAREIVDVQKDGLEIALVIGAEAILMAKNGVEEVYDGDPRVDPNAEFLPELTHLEAIERGLRVMDATALSLCMDNGLPIHVFELKEGNIKRIVAGERVGTIIQTPTKVKGATR